jgi:hypothetical protein
MIGTLMVMTMAMMAMTIMISMSVKARGVKRET